MNRLITFILLCFYFSSALSQNLQLMYRDCDGCDQAENSNPAINVALYDYGNDMAWEVEDLESDFDLRRAGAATRWHKGLDLRDHGRGADMQRGDALINPDPNGQIANLDHVGYKVIVIDGDEYDFGYGHIFSPHNITNATTKRSGNFVLVMDEGDAAGANKQPAIVNLNTCVAYSQFNNRMVILTNNPHCDNDTLISTNQVGVGEAFAPIGDSESNVNAIPDLAVHLHLYKLRDPTVGWNNNNCMDPLVDLLHPLTNFDLQLSFNQNIEPQNFDNWNQTSIQYPGNGFNTISYRASMNGAIQGLDESRYTNAAHNLDSIRLLIKDTRSAAYRLIYGPFYRSELLLRARTNTPLYPTALATRYANTTTTGISPRAYQDHVGFRPYDNYYFADFVTRIHEDDPGDGSTTPTVISNIPQTSRYNDGVYNIYSRVTDVSGNHSYSDTLQFKLDNYKPYIQKVKVVVNNTTIYQESWSNQGDSCILFSNTNLETTLNAGDIDDGMEIFIQASEELDSIALSIPAFAIVDKEPIENDTSTGYHFKFEISGDDIEVDSAKVRLLFKGKDVGNNELISIDAADLTSCYKIPLRATDTTWTDGNTTDLKFGTDTIHVFEFNCPVDTSGFHENNRQQTQGTVVTLASSPISLHYVVTDATTNTSMDGAIDLIIEGGVEPYNVLWTSGQQYEDLSEIKSGEYCVTVTDDFCGFAEICITVEDGCEPFFIGTWDIDQPEDCGKAGYIYYNNDAEGGVPEYSIHWTNEAGNTIPGGSTLKRNQGIFTLHVTGENGCEETADIEILPLPLAETQLYSYPTPSCVDANGNSWDNGTILVEADPPGVEVIYTWFDGTTETGNASRKESLAPGNYCVTVSAEDHNCTWELCEEVLGSDDLPLLISPVVTHPCEADNGQVSLNISGGVPLNDVIYYVSWSDGAFKDHMTRYNLSNGEITATVTDHCEQMVVRTFHLDNLDADFIVTPGCNNGLGTADLVVTGGKPPYSIQWTDGYIGNLPRVDMVPGEYNVSIADDDNCTISRNFDIIDLGDQIQILENNPACSGYNDGSVTIQVINPFGGPIHATLFPIVPCPDCPPVSAYESQDSINIIEFEKLRGNIEYEAKIYFEGCTLIFPFSIGELANENTYSHYEEIEPDLYVCHYDQICRDHLIEDGLTERAFMESENECDPGNPTSDCGKISYKCGNVEVASRDVNKIWLRRLEVQMLALELGYSQDYVDTWLGGNWCDRMLVCPNNPECVGFINYAGGKFIRAEWDEENGCVRVICRLGGIIGIGRTYKITGLNGVPDFVPPYIKPYVDEDLQVELYRNCNHMTKDFAQLVHFLPFLISDVPGFENSELHNLLETNKTDPAIWCAEVTYCTDSFNVINHNLDEVNCQMISDPESFNLSSGVENTCVPIYDIFVGDLDAIVFCWSDECYQSNPPFPGNNPECHPYANYISLDYDNFNLQFGNSNENVQIIQNIDRATSFVRFSTMQQSSELVWPNGIYSDDKQLLYHPFKEEQWSIQESDNLEFVHHDPLSNFIFAVFREKRSNTYRVGSGYFEGGLSDFVLRSTQFISLNNIRFANQIGYISGTYSGDLLYNESLVERSNDKKSFIALLDETGNISSFYSFELNEVTECSDPASLDKCILVEATSDRTLIAPSTKNIKLTDLLSGSTKRLPLTLNEEIKIEKFTTSASFQYFIISGEGSINSNNNTIKNSEGDIQLLCFSNDFDLVWVKKIRGLTFGKNKVNIASGNDDKFFLTINFENEIFIENQEYRSHGGIDILIIEVSNKTETTEIYHFGSIDDEFISDTYYSQGVLFLGGEAHGESIVRQIGDQQIIKLPKDQNHAFISFLSEYSTSQSSSEEALNNQTPSKNISIYPNPTTGELHISLSQNPIFGEYKASIFDINGKLLLNSKHSILTNNYNWSLNLPSELTGVYILKIEFPNKTISSTKIIKL